MMKYKKYTITGIKKKHMGEEENKWNAPRMVP